MAAVELTTHSPEANADTILFDPTRHEALCATPWSEGVARLAISEIVVDTLAHFNPKTLWPTHPRDADLGDAMLPAAALYHGAAA